MWRGGGLHLNIFFGVEIFSSGVKKFSDMVWYGMVWYGMVWYGMVWYGMVWYGIILFD